MEVADRVEFLKTVSIFAEAPESIIDMIAQEVTELVVKTNERIILKGEITSPINPKPGCRFAARCIYATPECSNPQNIVEVSKDHYVSCHMIGKNDNKNQ